MIDPDDDEKVFANIPGLDDWYDAALKAGQGFKSPEERQAYIDSLGDPMKHPMFAQTTEDLEGSPLVDALRALKEEDKSPYEIAIMYKDEGNEWLKKGDAKSLHEAFNRYTHAISILEGTAQAVAAGVTSEETNEERELFLKNLESSAKLVDKNLAEGNSNKPSSIPTESLEDTKILQSQIYSNRALACLNLKNYRSCINDADKSIYYESTNIKAHYRKIKALGMNMIFTRQYFC